MTTKAKPRCQALDMSGRQCRREAVRAVQYHGDGELYGTFTNVREPQWVRVWFCDQHSEVPRKAKR